MHSEESIPQYNSAQWWDYVIQKIKREGVHLIYWDSQRWGQMIDRHSRTYRFTDKITHQELVTLIDKIKKV